MGRGLPNHLASLLRHHAPEKPAEEQVKAKETGRAARRRAARSKRKIQKAERHSQEQEKRRARKAERANRLVAQEDAQPPVQVAEVPSEIPKKRQGKSKTAVKNVKLKKSGNPPGPRASGVETLFDPEGAARDEALMRKLEKNLGIARDPSKRKKEERRIFEALGFDAAGTGMEEPLSSDEQGPEEVPSSHGPAPANRLPAEGDSSADAMASLLETILGGKSSATEAEAAGPKKKRRVAKSLKMARRT
ncbi:unnamed protein product [Symbiodinium sp. CCMP2592]|nr:unnamed protein product [Symbiodinium sp. CCMP2592]